MRRIVALAASALAVGGACAAGPLDAWHVYGVNTARASYYGAAGAGAGSPYPFRGAMGFDEFNVYLDRSVSRYQRWRGEVSGVIDVGDAYRARHSGLVPERLNLTGEDGTARIPYRVEIGDLFAYLSFATLQRSLKGVQLELQPFAGNPARRHSVLLTTGTAAPDYRALTPADDYFNAASWLIDDRNLGTFGLNFVHSFRDASSRLGTINRTQYVLSAVWERPFVLGAHALVLEAEAAHFDGDHDGASGAASGQDRSENGYHLELSGRHRRLPWDYRLRFEHYGQDFRPAGAVVTPDRRSLELHSGWRFASGLRLRGRVQAFDDGFEAANTTRTRTVGANLSGPFLAGYVSGLSGAVDVFVQDRDDDSGAVDTLTESLNANVSKALGPLWLARAGLFLQDIEDESPANTADRLTRQVSVSVDRTLRLPGGWRGVVTPGLLVRTQRKGASYTTDWGPALALTASGGAHSVRIDYRGLLSNRKLLLSGPDVDTSQLNLDYRYRRGRSEFGLEGNVFLRDPAPGASTEAYRLSVFWRYGFDKPLRTAARGVAPLGATPAAAPALDLRSLAPGRPREAVERALARAGIGGGVAQAGFVVYEYPLLTRVLQRQRLALRYGGGVLERAVLIIDFDDVGSPESVVQTFERVREALVRALGPPARSYRQGEFTGDVMADVNAGRLRRIMEWDTPEGVIRFGIPRRLDGQVRMEIHHARRMPPPSELLWSIEGVR